MAFMGSLWLSQHPIGAKLGENSQIKFIDSDSRLHHFDSINLATSHDILHIHQQVKDHQI